MKIALCARTFPPLIGGLENVAELTAQALGEMGHDVTVVTHQGGPAIVNRAYKLVRRPTPVAAVAAYRKADYVVMLNVSLRMLLPVWLSRRPLVLWHHGLWYAAAGSPRDSFAAFLKLLVIYVLVRKNLACSNYIAGFLPSGAGKQVVPNPYDSALFNSAASPDRPYELLFVGRLVSDKGADYLLKAVAVESGPLSRAALSIIGSGPEEAPLRSLAHELGVASRVRFLGPKRGTELRDLMAAHQVMVVPSMVEESFGIVALEGLAVGCKVVVFRSGGLPEAVGQCGEVVPKGDLPTLRACLARLLDEPDACAANVKEAVARHLALHTPRAAATRLVEELGSVQRGGPVNTVLRRLLKPRLLFQPGSKHGVHDGSDRGSRSNGTGDFL
jgi:glycosyltransferase involved in cell wall biosynthesis